jgi:hypothetical protein
MDVKTVGKVVRMGDMRNAYSILVGKLEEKKEKEDTGVDVKII